MHLIDSTHDSVQSSAWRALERAVVWRRWHCIDIALTQLRVLWGRQDSGENERAPDDDARIDKLIVKLEGWCQRGGSLSPLGVRLLNQLPREIKDRLPATVAGYAESRGRKGDLEIRLRQARALLLAFEQAQPGPDRSLWLVRQHVKATRVPPALLQKRGAVFKEFADAIEKLAAGCRDRQADAIVEAIAAILELAKGSDPAIVGVWSSYWRSVEYEALNRLFIWPLLLLPGAASRDNLGVALPVFVLAFDTPVGLGPRAVVRNGHSVIVKRREKRMLAGTSQPADWHSVANSALRHARLLVSNHHRHLDASAVAWLERSSVSIDLAPADLLAVAFDGGMVEPCDASVSALLATSFGAALMRRPMPLIGITGGLTGTADGRRGPKVRAVSGARAKENYVGMSGLYDLLILPKEQAEDMDESGERHEWQVPTRHAATLADIFDIAFLGRWRRYQRRRLPVTRSLPTEDRHARVAEWFQTASLVANLPDSLTVDDVESYLHRERRAVASQIPAPAGISQVTYATTEEDVSGWGLVQLAQAMECALPTPVAISDDDAMLAAGFAALLDAPAGLYLNRPPDLLVLVKHNGVDLAQGSLQSLAALAEAATPLLRQPRRHASWMQRIGITRVIIANAQTKARTQLPIPDDPLSELAAWLGLFRHDFSDAQARALVSSRIELELSMGEAFAELRRRGWMVPSVSSDRHHLTVHFELAVSPLNLAIAHQQIAATFATAVLANPAVGASDMDGQDSLSTSEAAYHLIQATKLFDDNQDVRARSCADMLVKLIAFGLPMNCRHIHLAATLNVGSTEPLIAMALELRQAGHAWKPATLNALANLLIQRITDFEKRRQETAAIHEGESQLRDFALWLTDVTLRSFETDAPALGAAATLYNSGTYAITPHALGQLREALLQSVRNESTPLANIPPNVLHRLIHDAYDRGDRHLQYKRALTDGHRTHAALFLAALGTSPDWDVAQAFLESELPQLGPKGARFISTLRWRSLPSRLRSEMEAGYEYFAELA